MCGVSVYRGLPAVFSAQETFEKSCVLSSLLLALHPLLDLRKARIESVVRYFGS